MFKSKRNIHTKRNKRNTKSNKRNTKHNKYWGGES